MEYEGIKEIVMVYKIEAVDLTKQFRIKKKSNIIKRIFMPQYTKFKAVDNLNLKIESGERFGLLGPNGDGKTTTINMLCGLTYPSSGQIYIDGLDLLKHRGLIQKIGVMFSDKMLYNLLTGYQNLRYFAKIFNVKNQEARIKGLLEQFELEKWKDEYVSNY